MAPEEEKYVKEIEKLIKRTFPQDQAPPPERAPRARRESRQEPRAASDSGRAHAPRKAVDPWFDKPYEPEAGNDNTAPRLNQKSSKSTKQVAALLGGLRVNRDNQ